MYLRFLCLILVLLASRFAGASEKKWPPNYVLVLPKVVRPTAVSTISVQVEDKNVALRIDSSDSANAETVTGATSFFPNGSGVVNYRLPFENYRSKSVELAFTSWVCKENVKSCSRGGPRLFYRKVTLPILKDPLFIFTETSKPIYKPGEVVRFRILPLSMDSLHPSQIVSGAQKDLTFDVIYVEAPGKIRLAQWRNMSWTDALDGKKLLFRLSADPPLGKWKIVAKINGVKDEESFQVEKYVLPRFIVSVKPPSYIYIRDSTVKFRVCAKYTTEKSMKGTIRAQLCVKPRLRFRGEPMKRPCINAFMVLNGSQKCVEFNESTKALYLGNRRNEAWNAKTVVNVTVTENGTDAVVTKTKVGGALKWEPFKIVPRFADTFRPGLPFYGQILTVNHDGTPRPKMACKFETWIACDSFFMEVLTSDANGIVRFVLPPLPKTADSVTLVFKTVTSGKSAVSFRKKLVKTYSPSNTFIQTYPLDQLPPQKPCSSGKLTILLQSNVALFNRTIFVLSTARGNIQTITSFQPTAADDCEDQDDIYIGHYTCVLQKDGTYKIRCLPGWKGDNCRTAICKDGCLNGLCSAPDKCLCKNGWAGKTCNRCKTRRECYKVACYNGYWCRRFRPRVSVQREIDVIKPIPAETDNDPASKLQNRSLFSRQVDIPISTDLYPASKIVIWFAYKARTDLQELVATSVTLKNLQDCLSKSSPTSFSFNRKTVRPGEKVTASIRTSGSAPKCALTISDVALEAFGARGGLGDSSLEAEIAKVVNEMLKQHLPDPYNVLREDYCRNLRRRSHEAKRVICRSMTLGNGLPVKDSSFFFKEAGAFVISNIPVVTALHEYPLWFRVDQDSPTSGIMNGNSEVMESRVMPFRQKAVSLLVRGTDLKEKVKQEVKQKVKQKVKARVRSFFPENWKFELLNNPKKSLSLKAPDSMTTWKSTMYCVSSKGIGLSPSDKLVVFQPFFLQIALPYSIKRGETAQIPVKVFSYRKECSEIVLSMKPSQQLESNGQQMVRACLCNYDQLTAYFRVRPKQLGKVPIKIEARSRASSRCPNPKGSSAVDEVDDAVLRQLLVEPEGIPEEMSFGDLLCASRKAVTVALKVSTPKKTGLTVVEASERAYLMWSGNVIGASLENLDSMVRMPVGCGEQNMITMVPSVYVLDYLSKTGAGKTQLMEKAREFIVIGYQRQLRFRRRDGSYSAFGHRDKVGSTWLTAFVLKSFVAAQKYVEIDRKVLNQALSFLKSKTGKSGCFREDGRIIHTEMQGGQGGKKDSTTITAYLLGALLEANEADDGVRVDTDPAIAAAVRCLHATAPKDTTAMQKISNYGVALRTYALTKWNVYSNLTRRFQDELRRRRSSEEGMSFWRGGVNAESSSYMRSWSRFVATDVETTAYALLSLLTEKEQSRNVAIDIIPSLRWLSGMRNERGGWFSTQDSLLALQALATFARGSANGTDLSVTIDSIEGQRQVTVNNNNKLLLSKIAIATPNSVNITVKGSGCLVVQANVLFNVQDAGREGAPFSLWANARQLRGRCDKAEVQVCVRYTGPSQQSGMAVVKAKMASGWQTTRTSIDSLNGILKDGGLKLIEVDPEKALVLYFDSFTAVNTCISFSVQRDIEVTDVKPMIIQVYDYYKPHETQEKSVQVVKRTCEKTPQSDQPPSLCPVCTSTNDTAENAILRLCTTPHFYASARMQEKVGLMRFIHRNDGIIKLWSAALKLPETCKCNTTGGVIIAVHTRRRSFSLDEDVVLDGDWTVINVFSLSTRGHKNLRGSCMKYWDDFTFVYDIFMQRQIAQAKLAAKMAKMTKKKSKEGKEEK